MAIPAMIGTRLVRDSLTRFGLRATDAMIVAVWLCYVVVVSLIATAASRDEGQVANPIVQSELHGFLKSLDGITPLARWDSIWYYAIATEGYTGTSEASRFTAGFYPMYPLAMHLVSRVFSRPPFDAGLWVSRAALLVALVLLSRYVEVHDPGADGARAAVFALLCFPSAFVLVAVYSESLFLAAVLGAFIANQRGRYGVAALAAFVAGATRVHGLALLPAFGCSALLKWRAGERSPTILAPAAGVALANIMLAGYFAAQFGDPMRYFTIKKEFWEAGFHEPHATFAKALERATQAYIRFDLGSLYDLLEIPCLYLLAFALVVMWKRRSWPEAVFVAGCAALTLFSGTTWGLPRFVLNVFPVFVALATLRRRPWLWQAALVSGALVQGCCLINYVNFRQPSP